MIGIWKGNLVHSHILKLCNLGSNYHQRHLGKGTKRCWPLSPALSVVALEKMLKKKKG